MSDSEIGTRETAVSEKRRGFVGYEVSRTLFTQRLFQGVLQYFLLGIQWLVALALFPRYLGAEGMGILSLILATRGILWPLVSLNLRTGCALNVASLENKEDIRRRYYSSFYFSIASTVLLSAVVLAVGVGFYPVHYVGLMLLLTAASIVQDFGTLPAQAYQKTGFLATYTCVVEYSGMLLGLGLASLGYGPEGVVVGWIVCYTLGSIFLHTLVARDIGLFKSIDFGIVRSYVVFSLPLILMALGQKGLETSDRYFLAHFAGMDQVGVYTVAYFAATPFLALVTGVSFVLYGTIVKLWTQDRAQFCHATKTLARYSGAILVIVLVLIYLLSSPSMVGMFAGEGFSEAAGPIPLIAFAYSLLLFGTLFVDMLLVVKKPALATIPFLVALAVNVPANWILVPPFGMMGAAGATAISYSVYAALVIRFALKKCSADFEAGPFLRMIGVGLGGVLIAWAIKSAGLVTLATAVPLVLGLAVILVTAMIIVKVVTVSEVRDVWKTVRAIPGGK